MAEDAMAGGMPPTGTAASLPASASRASTAALWPAASANALVPLPGKAYSVAARRRYADFLPETEAISQRRHSPYATWLLGALSALVIAAVAWMHFARIDEVASGPGIVRWADKAKVVSHPDGGRVVQMLVREGESVLEDQPLVLLDEDVVLYAPAEGVITRLKALNPGAALVPGETVAEIMPAEAARRFEIEARVSNSDIGAITVGQDAFMKFQAYDWVRHGTLRGTVVHIAPDGLASDTRLPSRPPAAEQSRFIVRIALDKDFVGDDPRRNRLSPGMTATVDLHVGERSILDFFTSGFRRTVGSSLRER
jgi:multidrug efflux pump subunit AcrA (membrane-fusion protein)